MRPRFVPPRSRAAGATADARVAAVLARLEAQFPDAESALRFRSPFELLAATILSAQCTDIRVNQVTPALFARFPTPATMAVATPGEVEALIRPTGFYRNKAKHLQGMARALLERHAGEVPREMEALVKLPGVGRKTANCIRGTAYGLPAMVVDTHVGRIARRLGWTRAGDAVRIEDELMRVIPEAKWTWLAHALILHGRTWCKSQRPHCGTCPLKDLCPSAT